MKGFAMKMGQISAVGFLFLSAVVLTGTAFPVTIRGWVIDNDTCQPITNVLVTCDFREFEVDQQAFCWVSDPEGYFQLQSSLSGPVSIWVYFGTDTGYVVWDEELYLHEDEVLDPVIITVQKGALVRGRVLWWDNTPPGPSWKYAIYADGRYVSASCTQEGNGYYSCRLPSGRYSISVDTEDNAGLEAVMPLDFDIPVGTTEITLPNIVLYDSRYAGGTISATITIPSLGPDYGAALVILPPGALVSAVTPEQVRSIAMTELSSSGTYSAAHLPPGTYDAVLVISSLDDPEMIIGRDLKRNIVVTKGNTTSITLSATTVGGTIRGQVINSYGSGIYGAQIMIRLGNVMYGQTDTDSRGRFQFSYVGPGTYSLALFHPHYELAVLTPSVTVANGQTVTLSTFPTVPFVGHKTGPDLNGNGYTGPDDLMPLASHWLMPYPAADFDASGWVNLPDLAAMERYWLTRDLWLGGNPKTPEGFVAVWEMNDNAANKIVADDTINGFPGTAQRNTSLLSTPGHIGTALSFDSTKGDYIDIGTDPVLLPSAWTISAWVKCNDAATPVLVSFGGNFPSIKLQNGSKGKPVIHLGSNNYRYFAASAWTTLKNGQWHHVAFTCPGKAQTDIQQARMFLDGVEVPGDTAFATGPQTDKTHLYLGANPSVAGQRFAGAMDHVYLYDRALSPDQILQLTGLYSGGTGTAENPYRISRPADWRILMQASGDWDKNFLLTNDLDLAGVALAPVAPDATPGNEIYDGKSFTGIFDGNGHFIRNAVINQPDRDCVGLFGQVGGQIRNLGLVSANIRGFNNVGGLAGELAFGGSITSCQVAGIVMGLGINVGGLSGYNAFGTVKSSTASAAVSGVDYVGGLVGECWGSITTSSSSGTITGNDFVGGLTGGNADTISSCFATGSVTGHAYVGGLTGGHYSGGTLLSCYAKGSVNGSGSSIGGLVGYNQTSWVTDCYATGRVTGGSPIGGLVGGSWLMGWVETSFWDTQTTVQTYSSGGTGITTSKMKTRSTFTNAGWDFLGESANGTADIWKMDADGTDYPRLSWE